MHRVVLDIPDNKFESFLKLVNQLGIKNIKSLTRQQAEYVTGLNHALDEVEEHLKNDSYLQNAKDFLKDL